MKQKLPNSGFVAAIKNIAEQRLESQLWRDHANNVRRMVLDDGNDVEVEESDIRKLLLLTEPRNIGHGREQIRFGELGKWDVYYSLVNQMGRLSAIILSGLKGSVVNRREALENACVDPDNADEVKEFDRIQQMTPEEVEGELERLEALLAD